MRHVANLDLYDLFQSLLLPREQPTGHSLSAVEIPNAQNYRLAKDANGSPCLLLRQSASSAPPAPIRLENLTVSYEVPCIISHPTGDQEEGSFTIIKCSTTNAALFPHFLRILSPVIATLGPTPTPAAVRRAISGLVDLFQALTLPAKKSIQGLWAELFVIRGASDPHALAVAWHKLPEERVDFVSGSQRLEVKSTANRSRIHHFSLVQLRPPQSTRLIVASIFVETIGNGLSLRALFDEIRSRFESEPALLTRLDIIFYATLGSGWSDAMEECFDQELARESLQFFDSTNIPKIEDPISSAVSDIRFTSDMTGASPLATYSLRSAGGLFAAVAPVESKQ